MKIWSHWYTVFYTEQVTSSPTTVLEEMTIDNGQLRRENDVLKADHDITQPKTKQKDEIGQLTTLLDKMAVTNENQIQQIKSLKDENKQLRSEVHMIKSENAQLKNENDDLKVS